MPTRIDTTLGDHSLMAGITRHDETAFADLFDRCSAAAFGLALRICRDRALAEDVAQEAFLSVWQKGPAFDADRGSAVAYLLRAVHNRAVDVIRHEESVRRRQDTAMGQFCPESSEDEVVEAAWIGLRRTEVRHALAGLTPLQREALELAYFGGLTHTEVAEALGIPLGTAKTRLRDGMTRLRGLLSRLGGGNGHDA